MTSSQESSPHPHHPSRRRSDHNRDGFPTSQARQLVEDLSRIVLQDDRDFNKALDTQVAEQEHLHRNALDRALAEHEAVRRAAELTRERIELEVLQERLKRELRQKQDVEERKLKFAEEQAAAQRKELELVRKAEDALKQAATLRAEKAAAERRVEDEERMEAESRQRDLDAKAAATQRKAQADAAAAEEAKQKIAQAATSGSVPAPEPKADSRLGPSAGQPLVVASSQVQPQSSDSSAMQKAAVTAGIITTTEQREVVHKKYLDLHKRLKGMRDDVKKQCSQHPQLKNALGDWRRAIIKCVGQQNKVDKAANKSSTNEINTILAKASSTPGPQIDISQYIIDYPEKTAATGNTAAPTQGPGILLFLLNHFAKCVIRQFIAESSVDGLTADPLGILTAVIFSKPDYQFHGISLIDLFWAKFHRCCPLLFGITGSQKTAAGRERLGWMREDGYAATSGHYITEDQYHQRLLGLGAGFSAVALRDFTRAKAANPTPNRLWWEALARLLNTPPDQVQPAHFVVLKGMLEHAIPRAITLFGAAGKAAVRQALVMFPQTATSADPGAAAQAKSLAAIASVLAAKHHSQL